MSKERKRILQMLSKDRITVDEAERLLKAVGEDEGSADRGRQDQPAKRRAKYLRVVVEPSEPGRGGESVNIRVPMKLLRAGIKLGSLIPDGAKEKVGDALCDKGLNIDLNSMNASNIEEIVEALCELTVDVDSGDEKVRIFCE